MADALPGDRLRPHVKAHKCTALARSQAAAGHSGFTCATMREMEGMAQAGLDDDLLLANEVADASRLGVLARAGARVTVAVDSDATIEAVARAGVAEVLIDVNVGLPRCGCRPDDAGRLADRARAPPASRCEGSWGTRAISSGCRIAPPEPPCSRNQWRSWPPRPNKSEAT